MTATRACVRATAVSRLTTFRAAARSGHRASSAPTACSHPDGSTFTYGLDNSLKPYEGANIDGYDRNQDRYLGVPVERYLATGLASYELSDNATLFFEGSYAKSKSRSSLEPQAVANTDLVNADGTGYAGIPITNPFIPTAIRDAMIAEGVTSLAFRRRSNDIFDRSNKNDRETWRAVAGLRGSFADKFDYEVYYGHGETKDYTRSGTIFGPQYVNALNAVAGPNGPVCSINVDADPGNDDAACVPLNIFGFNTASAAASAYVTKNGQLSEYRAKMQAGRFLGVGFGRSVRASGRRAELCDEASNIAARRAAKISTKRPISARRWVTC